MQHHDFSDLSADQIAARLDQDRAALAASIDDMRDRLSVDALLGDALGFAKTNLQPYARALDGAVRANPLAALMTGAGLAWLAFGGRRRDTRPPETPISATRFGALARWEDEGGPVAPLPEPDEPWIAEADELRDQAIGALARIDAAARAKLRPVAELAQDRAQVLADLAKATQAAMRRGLDGLGAEAQARILAVREQAYTARIAAMRQGIRLIEERPVVAGAISAAIGAALAAALPPTATEDRLFGDERDYLLRRADSALREERARASDAAARLAETLATEVKSSARHLVSEAS